MQTCIVKDCNQPTAVESRKGYCSGHMQASNLLWALRFPRQNVGNLTPTARKVFDSVVSRSTWEALGKLKMPETIPQPKAKIPASRQYDPSAIGEQIKAEVRGAIAEYFPPKASKPRALKLRATSK